jgi:hypothetical protein
MGWVLALDDFTDDMDTDATSEVGVSVMNALYNPHSQGNDINLVKMARE